MPSPLGHGLAAVAVGWSVAGPPEGRRALVRQVAILVAIGAAPDLDLLIGRHSMETHSIGAAVIVASIAAWQRWPVASSRMLIWIAVVLAWLSHPLLDALGSDTSAPIGVMALWPFSTGHFQTSWGVFEAISRRYWRDDFWSLNLSAAVREVLVLTPLVAMVALLRMRNWRN
jgi:inner membrane protein